MFDFPEPPRDLPADQRADGPVSLRYEDIAQDGRLILDAIPHGLGEVVWQNILARHPMSRSTSAAGVIPILTRLVVEGTGGPIAVRRHLDGEGLFQLAHSVDEGGTLNRILLNLWVDTYGKKGRTYGPPPEGAGERVHLGRVFAEHVFTRLFAPPGERKVLSLEGADPSVYGARYAWRAPEALLDAPPGATPLDELSPDSSQVVFGLSHTDSNQHVNSLVYPRLFEEAVLRRLAALGRSTALLSRYSEVAYRKPCFAGDKMRYWVRCFELGDKVVAVGQLSADDGGAQKPYCYLRVVLER